MLLNDPLYGDFEINEEVIVELMQSKPITRLKGVTQHGLPMEIKARFHPFTRYEHSVGVMLLLRKLGASTEEQVAGLIHDSSHTAFSHVIDWVLGDPSKEDYQDKALKDYIKESGISVILQKHGIDSDKLGEMEYSNHFGLLERNAPDLCADRVDYSLRDTYYKNKDGVKKCIDDLTVVNNEMIFKSRESAQFFGESYMENQREFWGGDDAKVRYHLLSVALKEALEKKVITINDLYKDEATVIRMLKASGNPKILKNLKKALGELKFVVSPDGDITLQKKMRYVDPKFFQDGKITKLSNVSPEYVKIIEAEKQRVKNSVRVFVSD